VGPCSSIGNDRSAANVSAAQKEIAGFDPQESSKHNDKGSWASFNDRCRQFANCFPRLLSHHLVTHGNALCRSFEIDSKASNSGQILDVSLWNSCIST
jgi:hypothetical protein